MTTIQHYQIRGCCGKDTLKLYRDLVQSDQEQLDEILSDVSSGARSLIIRLLNMTNPDQGWVDNCVAEGDTLRNFLLDHLKMLSETTSYEEFVTLSTPLGFLSEMYPHHSAAVHYLVLSWFNAVGLVKYGTGLDHCWLSKKGHDFLSSSIKPSPLDDHLDGHEVHEHEILAG